VEDSWEGPYDPPESSTRQEISPVDDLTGEGNGSVGSITLHVMHGTADEIKAHLLDSVDTFFDISADA